MSADYFDLQSMLDKLLGKSQVSMMAQQPQGMGQVAQDGPTPENQRLQSAFMQQGPPSDQRSVTSLLDAPGAAQQAHGPVEDPMDKIQKEVERLLQPTPEEAGRLEGVNRALSKAQGGSIVDLFDRGRGRQRELSTLLEQRDELANAPRRRAADYLNQQSALASIGEKRAHTGAYSRPEFASGGADTVQFPDGSWHRVRPYATPQGVQLQDLGVAPNEFKPAGGDRNTQFYNTRTGESVPGQMQSAFGNLMGAQAGAQEASRSQRLSQMAENYASANLKKEQTKALKDKPEKEKNDKAEKAAERARLEAEKGIQELKKSMAQGRAALARKLQEQQTEPEKFQAAMRAYDNDARAAIAREEASSRAKKEKKSLDYGEGVTVVRVD